MIQILLQVVVPAFVVVAAGAALGRAFRLEMTPINRVALYAAVPALVFSALADSDVAWTSVGLLLGGNAAYLVAMAGVAWVAGRLVPRRARRGLLATSLFANAANIMLPVTLFAFGHDGLQRALILYVWSAVLIFTLGPIVLGGGNAAERGGRLRFLAAVAKLPVLWAALAGVAVNLIGASVPLGLMRGVDLLGEAAIPLVLLTLGLQMHRTGVRAPSLTNLLGAALRLGVAPALAYLAAWAIGARGVDLAVLTLLGAMPPAVNNFMLALEFGGDAEEVAGTVITATFASVATLTVVLSLLQGVVS
ncbi:MAG: AEC family transporter [Trueperaceae bacterium]